MADAKFTKAEIVAWSEEAGRRLTPELLSKAPLTEQQRARVKQLRAEAAEYSRRLMESTKMDEDDLKRFKEYVKRSRHERSGSKEIAFQYLYEHGYILENGKLAPKYGGPQQPEGRPWLRICLWVGLIALIIAAFWFIFR